MSNDNDPHDGATPQHGVGADDKFVVDVWQRTTYVMAAGPAIAAQPDITAVTQALNDATVQPRELQVAPVLVHHSRGSVIRPVGEAAYVAGRSATDMMRAVAGLLEACLEDGMHHRDGTRELLGEVYDAMGSQRPWQDGGTDKKDG